jgi:hypothetical protein
MIHLLEDEDIEVAEIPRDEKSYNLAAAILQYLVSYGPALKDEIHDVRLVPFFD